MNICRRAGSSTASHLVRAVFAAVALAGVQVAAPASAGKDMGPAGACDGFAMGSPGWTACAGRLAAARPTDEDLFYAGYWMARTGRYAEAISYLQQSANPDARTLTYIGFATRKSGDVDGAFPYYRKALALDPNFVVARAYLGEAHLSRGDVSAARSELAEIARRCGAACAAYDDLARHIARHEHARG